MATAAKRFKKDVDEILECPICSLALSNPKLLICGHTICLTCLEQLGQDKEPGEKVPCPECRITFKIPEYGMSSLRRNLLISKIIECKTLAEKTVDENAVMCVCNEDAEKDPEKVAKWYCVYCDDKLCDQCKNGHKKHRLTKEHQIVEIGEEETEHLLKRNSRFCEKHTAEQIKLYCCGCELVLCTKCFVSEHKGHHVDDIDTIAENHRQLLQTTYENLITKTKDHTNLLANQIAKKETFVADITKIEIDLDKQILEIEKHTKKLKQITACLRINHMQKIEENEQNLKSRIEIFKTYSEQIKFLMEKSSAVDVCCNADNVKNKEGEFEVMKPITVISLRRFVFIPSTLDEQHSFIGKVVALDEKIKAICPPHSGTSPPSSLQQTSTSQPLRRLRQPRPSQDTRLQQPGRPQSSRFPGQTTSQPSRLAQPENFHSM